MFSFLKPKFTKSPTESLLLHLTGLHCTSCAVNIDLTLEDLPGVTESKTNYQKSTTQITFDPKIIHKKQIIHSIESLGYSVVS